MRQSFLGQVFPLVVASVAAFFGVIGDPPAAVFERTAPTSVYDQEEAPENCQEPGRRAPCGAGRSWIALLVGLTALVGFFLAMLAFFLIYLPVRARTGPIKTLVLTAGAATFVLVLANALNLNFPYGLLQDMGFACPGRCADRSLRCVNVPYPLHFLRGGTLARAILPP